MKKSIFIVAGTMVIVIASLWFISCDRESAVVPFSDETLSEVRSNADSMVFPPSAFPYGKSYTDWTVLWIQKFLSFDCSNNPYSNPENTMFQKEGPVWFLAGSPIERRSVNVKLKVPRGKAILFPLINYVNGYPCPVRSFEPAPGQRLEDFLREGSLKALAGVRGLSVDIDGIPVTNPFDYLFTSRMFSFTGNPELATCFDICVTGQPQKAVSNGYYMLLKPLPKGTHTLHYHAEIPALDVVHDRTYYIEVTEWDNAPIKNHK